jgi:glycosyltransferase involved in cell wall biosynthesis
VEECDPELRSAQYSAAIGYDRRAVASVQPLVVGLSSNVLEPAGDVVRVDGIGMYTRELERALASAGHDVVRVGAPVVRPNGRIVRARVASRSFALPLPAMVAMGSALPRRVGLAPVVERGLDVYHATDYLVPALARTPVVATVYDAIPLAHPEWVNPRLRLLKNWLLRQSVSRADAVIAISKAARDELVEHYRVPAARIRVVPLGVHERWFQACDTKRIERVLARDGLRRGFILHVGTLQPRKNIDALVSAYEALPAHVREARQLVLVGKYGWRAEALRERLLRLADARRVVWLDYVDDGDLCAIYHAAGMFVFPSLAEGFGLPVLEALAAGLPVIANDLPALREAAESVADWVDARRVDAMAAAMERRHETIDTEALRALRRDHAARFTWETCAEETCDVYREVIGSCRA